MFVDEALVKIKAGKGGAGCIAFRREKFIPRGGPWGGDGGDGGSVVLHASQSHNTLVHFKYRPEQKSENGRQGEGCNRTGRSGNDLVLEVPAGTIVFDADSGERLFDFTEVDQKFTAARGGHGGRGNARFKSSTNQAPRFAEPGTPGEFRTLRLELKLLADVGLVGFPNAGKSTLISRISAARPKIADYPFTTLQPNLGVVDLGEFDSFLVADIPGLIEGAHEGHGLGDRFLRHIERTAILVHLVDVSESSGREPVEDYQKIVRELANFSETLAEKPTIVVATKLDVVQDPERLTSLEEFCEKGGLEFRKISAVTGEGINQLVHEMGSRVRLMREEMVAVTAP
jgi:GTP-binding protein